MVESDEIRSFLSRTDPVLKAMVLLGINCGFGNTDVASLPQSAVNLETGWIEFPRPKTEINRRVPLWPETVAALRDALTIRPEPTDTADSDNWFVTLQRNRFVRVQESKKTPGKFVTINAVARRFDPLVKKLDTNGRKGLGFYTLRHTFATIAGESRDQVAVNAIMGHVDSSMAGAYRERISDERLIAVTDTVHQWLFGS
jgi:integrase